MKRAFLFSALTAFLLLPGAAAQAPNSQKQAIAGDLTAVQRSLASGSSIGEPIEHVIVISVDGLMPASYTDPDGHGLAVPVLRELVRQGAWSPGVRVVMPAVTYPSHTTIATGVSPGLHGIVANRVFDPMETSDEGWNWYTEDIRVPTLWDAARAKGLGTALISWPVTVGARADFVLPEFWRGKGTDSVKLLRAISTSGLVDKVARQFPNFLAGLTPPTTKDEALADVAVHILETSRPNLLMLHIFEVDHWQHEKGPWSPEAVRAIENADAQIARLIAAARKAGTWKRTVLVIVSDHGFARQEKLAHPGVLLQEKGLIALDEKNKIRDWKAQVLIHGGSAYVYLKDTADAETRRAVVDIFQPLSGAAGSGVARVFGHDRIVELGGDPQAFLVVEAAEGFGFETGITGPYITPAIKLGLHGFPPDRDDMLASLLILGPGIAPGKIEGARLVDIAPTIASWLGLTLEAAEGQPLRLAAKPIQKNKQ
jgi:predicted AlkP superfamily pyrophosphatase or phosphodiesterase